MPKPNRDGNHEQRIMIEIVVNAYRPEEQSMGEWH